MSTRISPATLPYVRSTILLAAALTSAGCSRCEGERSPAPRPRPQGAAAEVGASAPAERALLLVQAQFTEVEDKVVPGPAKLVVLRPGEPWSAEVIEDESSNVFHKAVFWEQGILTIGGTRALLRHWRRDDSGRWQATTLWERSWGGRIDRLRDLELGDVDDDGEDELVIATHDQGVVVIGDRRDDKWEFTELGRRADVFVHEIEIGDVDGDGHAEAYATPSDRNRSSGLRQPGSVIRYSYEKGAYVATTVVAWARSHAKEILVADIDGNGRDELYAVREAEIELKPNGEREIVTPVRVVVLAPGADGRWTETTITTIDDRGARFLVPGDIDGDGLTDLILASMHAGLFWLRQNKDHTLTKTLIDAESSGFEHASHVADLDDDGRMEIYVAADDQGALRRYQWVAGEFSSDELAKIPTMHITWNITQGQL